MKLTFTWRASGRRKLPMRFGRLLNSGLAGLVLLCMSALAQAPVASDAEKHELAVAVEEANTSGFDMIRALEAHLRKYPSTSLRPEIINLLAKAAVETRDEARIVKYGEPVLLVAPNDGTLLDRVARALLDAGGKD